MSRTKAVLFGLALVSVAAGARVSADPQTWAGKISDSMCGKTHTMGGTKPDAAKCTVDCVKGGAKYVLVVGDKVYKIANQKFADLEKHPGVAVQVTGELKDDTITVTKVVVQKVQ
jgi:hypothetical protein